MGIFWDVDQPAKDRQAKRISGLLGESITSEMSGTSMEFDELGNPINLRQQAPTIYDRQGTGFLGSDRGVASQMALSSGLQTIGGLDAGQAQQIMSSQTGQNKNMLDMLKLNTDMQAKQREESIKQGNVLRKQRDEKLTPFNEAKTQYNTTMNALQQDSGAGTLAAIFSFMKTLDPRSVVREGEFQMGTQTGGIVDSLVGMVNRARGEGMGPEARKSIADTIQAIMEGRKADAEAIAERFDLIATQQGVPTSQIRTGAYDPDLQGVPEYFDVKQDLSLPKGSKNMGGGIIKLPDGTLIRKKR